LVAKTTFTFLFSELASGGQVNSPIQLQEFSNLNFHFFLVSFLPGHESTDKRKDPQMEIVAVFKRIPKNQLTRHTTLFSLRSVP
jgi:hypothetical protein